MFSSVLTNVSIGTADILAYFMLALIVVFLVTGPLVIYYYRKKMKETKPSPATVPA